MAQKEDKAIRTTLYLSQKNKKWLETQPKGQRTLLINKAINKLKEEEEMEEKKQKVLKSFDNLPLYKTEGKSIKETLNDGRTNGRR